MVTESTPAEPTAEPAAKAATQPAVAEAKPPVAGMPESTAEEPVPGAVVDKVQVAIGTRSVAAALCRHGPNLRIGGLAGDRGQRGSDTGCCAKSEESATRHHDDLHALRYKLGRHVGSRVAALTHCHAVVRVS